MRKKKYIAIVACILAVSIIFTGCGSSTSLLTANGNGNVIYGKVTAIDGKSITITLAESGGKNDGQQPQGGAIPSGGQKPQGSAPAQPSGAPSGQQPQGGGPGGFTLTGESKTITVTDKSVITTSSFGQNTSTKASLSDIKADAILSITMSGNTVTAITIMNTGGGDKAAPSTNASPAESSSAAVPS